MVSVLIYRSRGRGSTPAGRRRSRSNRGSVALCTLGLGLLNPPSFRGRQMSTAVPATAGKVEGRHVRPAWCAPCTWAPLRWAVPTKGRYNKCSTFTFAFALQHLTPPSSDTPVSWFFSGNISRHHSIIQLYRAIFSTALHRTTPEWREILNYCSCSCSPLLLSLLFVFVFLNVSFFHLPVFIPESPTTNQLHDWTLFINSYLTRVLPSYYVGLFVHSRHFCVQLSTF